MGSFRVNAAPPLRIGFGQEEKKQKTAAGLMMAASVVNFTFELDSFSFFVPHEYLYHIGIAQLFAYRR